MLAAKMLEGKYLAPWFPVPGPPPPGPRSCLPLWKEEPARVSEDLPGFNVSAFTDGSPDALQNPCYLGTHGCDTNAACRPGPGTQFTCECSIGFRGDGRTCYGTAVCSEWEVAWETGWEEVSRSCTRWRVWVGEEAPCRSVTACHAPHSVSPQ